MTRRPPTLIDRDEARLYLVGQLDLAAPVHPPGAEGVRSVLAARRAIQLDPLDPLGTNADLVALARVDGIAKGDIYRHVYPGHAFEHFAKERCLLPASAFPYYRHEAVEATWWRSRERLERLPTGVLDAVMEEIERDGPLTTADLTHHGHVEPLDWSGWKGTGRAASLAVEVLWWRCMVVTCGRRGNTKLFDIPERALPDVAVAPAGPFAPWALVQRVEAAGLLSRAGGAHWSMLSHVRTTPLADELVARGTLVEVVIDGSARPYLAPADFRARTFPPCDDRMRILGPLDPLLWDRALVRHVFGFDYVWEVYKPEELRRWGWYVCPLLHRGRLVGRLEGRLDGKALKIGKIWREDGVPFDEDALDAALARHAEACGVSKVKRPKRFSRERA